MSTYQTPTSDNPASLGFTYHQSNGVMYHGDKPLGTGYSGKGEGLNNPAAQNLKGVGPIPRGRYTIAVPHADQKVGPIAMRLSPHPDNVMFGRGDFLIHGDNAGMDYTASEGCIILSRVMRLAIGGAVLAGDDLLTVAE